MIKYFFKLAFRNIRKYKVNTLISLLGLTVGLASFILIASYIKHELSFNTFNKNYDHIFISKINYYGTTGTEQGGSMPYPVVEELTSNYPEVKYGVRFSPVYAQLENKEISFFENNATYVDNEFFKIFSVDFLSGDKISPLQEPNTIVLTKKTAGKYFDKENPIGKSLLLEGKHNLKVTAVIDDLPLNSDFRFDFFISMNTLTAMNPSKDYSQSWDNHQFKTVFLLDEKSDIRNLNEKLKGFFDNKNSKITIRRELELIPLSKHHLKQSDDDNSLKIVIIFGLVAVFILVIACLNFINLAIANAANRIKETSIQRIVGSKKSSLILQQIGESVLLSFISFDLAYLTAERLLPQFNAILKTQIPSSLILNIPFILAMFLTAITLGLVSGIFPAIKISRIKPMQALTGKGNGLNRTGAGRKGLVVFQYSVSIILIIATIILSNQFKFIKNRDLGFNSESLITAYVGTENELPDSKLKIFKNEILGISGVQSTALSRQLPFYGNIGTTMRKVGDPEDEIISVDYNYVEESFFDTYGIEIILKREFSINNQKMDEEPSYDFIGIDKFTKKALTEYSLNSVAYCYINQTAADALNFQNPIGERIVLWDKVCEIVGVHKDFHVYTVQSKIPPQVLVLNENESSYNDNDWMTVKCDGKNLNKIKDLATEKLREFFPDNPYSFFYYGSNDFKAETLNKIQGVEKLFGIFTFIAIVIACMGIFGLVALSVKNKTREIGIRKTLGSSVFAIYKLIAKEYIVLAVLGNILAWLPAWYISNKILQDFAYRIDISIFVFIIGFVSSFVLTFITIAFHTIKAARTNPVEALRYE